MSFQERVAMDMVQLKTRGAHPCHSQWVPYPSASRAAHTCDFFFFFEGIEIWALFFLWHLNEHAAAQHFPWYILFNTQFNKWWFAWHGGEGTLSFCEAVNEDESVRFLSFFFFSSFFPPRDHYIDKLAMVFIGLNKQGLKVRTSGLGKYVTVLSNCWYTQVMYAQWLQAMSFFITIKIGCVHLPNRTMFN